MDNLEKRKEKRKNNRGLVTLMAVISSILGLCCLTCIIIIIILSTKTPVLEPNVATLVETIDMTYSQEELEMQVESALSAGYEQAQAEFKADLKAAYMSGESIVNKLRVMYPEDMIFYDADHYEFIPIQNDLPLNPYFSENLLVSETGEVSYDEGGEIVSVKGIDVSKYQGKIDWNKVANAGIEFAILRVGIRGYSSGAIVLDDTFEENLKNATAAGIDVGVYFFTQAINETEAIEEANFVLDAIEGYSITYPVIIDVEVIHDSTARTYELSADDRTNNCLAFCETVEAAGYTPMIYGNLKTFGNMLDISRLVDYDKWFAYYDTSLYFPYSLSMWQYTDKATIDGIEGPVDLNITFEKKWGN